MKITKRMLKQLIKEEFQNVLQENPLEYDLRDPHEVAIRRGHGAWGSNYDDEEAAEEIETWNQAREDAAEREAGKTDAWQGPRGDTFHDPDIHEPRFGTMAKMKAKRARAQKTLDNIDQQIDQLQGLIDRSRGR